METRRPWTSSSQMASTVPRLSVGEDHGLADKLGVGLLERVKDRGRATLHRGDAGLAFHCNVADLQ